MAECYYCKHYNCGSDMCDECTWGSNFESKEEEMKVMPVTLSGTDGSYYFVAYSTPKAIKKVIFNDPATILIFEDGTKSIVKCMKGDTYDPEKGFALAYLKDILGERKYKEVLKRCKKEIKDETN